MAKRKKRKQMSGFSKDFLVSFAALGLAAGAFFWWYASTPMFGDSSRR